MVPDAGGAVAEDGELADLVRSPPRSTRPLALGVERTTLSPVAFYADYRHEVLRVQSGYRITLTGYEQVCGWTDGAWAGRPGKAGPP